MRAASGRPARFGRPLHAPDALRAPTRHNGSPAPGRRAASRPARHPGERRLGRRSTSPHGRREPAFRSRSEAPGAISGTFDPHRRQHVRRSAHGRAERNETRPTPHGEPKTRTTWCGGSTGGRRGARWGLRATRRTAAARRRECRPPTVPAAARRRPGRPGRQGAGATGSLTTTSRPLGRLVLLRRTGGDLLSRAREGQVPSALWGLTALFGMGRGVSPTPKPPEIVRDRPGLAPRTPVLTDPQNHTACQHHGYQKYPSSPRPISTGLLRVLPRFQIRPINLVVYQGSYSLKGMGELISRPASRLDAFSGYPIRT